MKENQKLVSIILNCYNGEKYLKDALETVKNQSYENWELIFWDNQSDDNSKGIFNSYKIDKFKYFQSIKHTTLYEARNLAIKECKGEFIAFIDTDDLWELNKLKEQIRFFDDKEVGVVYGNMWILNERLNKKKIFSRNKLLTGKIFKEIIPDYKIGIIASVIRKKVLTENKLFFDSTYNHIGDFDLFVKLSKVCKFEAIQKPVATYRVHGDNLTLKNSSNEILEMKQWLIRNKNILNKDQEEQFKVRIFNRELIDIKFTKSFLETFKFFLSSKLFKKNIKNYLLLILPLFILKKIMWYQ